MSLIVIVNGLLSLWFSLCGLHSINALNEMESHNFRSSERKLNGREQRFRNGEDAVSHTRSQITSTFVLSSFSNELNSDELVAPSVFYGFTVSADCGSFQIETDIWALQRPMESLSISCKMSNENGPFQALNCVVLSLFIACLFSVINHYKIDGNKSTTRSK